MGSIFRISRVIDADGKRHGRTLRIRHLLIHGEVEGFIRKLEAAFVHHKIGYSACDVTMRWISSILRWKIYFFPILFLSKTHLRRPLKTPALHPGYLQRQFLQVRGGSKRRLFPKLGVFSYSSVLSKEYQSHSISEVSYRLRLMTSQLRVLLIANISLSLTCCVLFLHVNVAEFILLLASIFFITSSKVLSKAPFIYTAKVTLCQAL